MFKKITHNLQYLLEARKRRVPTKVILSKIMVFLFKVNKNLSDGSLKTELENQMFVRFVMYKDLIKFVKEEFHSKEYKNPKIIEFGGSNGFIGKIFNHPNYEVAENYPNVDIQNLRSFKSNYYNFIILDQVLEHIPDPQKAVAEVHRLLKKGGWLISATPFLVQIHPSPDDYWRYTKSSLKLLLSKFSEVRIKSWGNKEIAIYHLKRGGWPSTKEMRKNKKFLLRNDEYYPVVLWSYSRK